MLKNLVKEKNVKSLTNNEQKNISGGNPGGTPGLNQHLGCQLNAAAVAGNHPIGSAEYEIIFEIAYELCMEPFGQY